MRDRRFHPRVRTNAKVVVVGAGSHYMATMSDICRNGARLEFPSSTAEGTELMVVLSMGAQAFFRLKGRVVSLSASGLSLMFEEELDEAMFETLAVGSLLAA